MVGSTRRASTLEAEKSASAASWSRTLGSSSVCRDFESMADGVYHAAGDRPLTGLDRLEVEQVVDRVGDHLRAGQHLFGQGPAVGDRHVGRRQPAGWSIQE